MTAPHPFIDGLRPLLEAVRTDVTAVKRPDRPFASWTTEPLTAANLAAHFNGAVARGCAQIKAGQNTTRVALFDLDSHGGEVALDGMIEVARLLMTAGLSRNLQPHAFLSSGGRGVHVYFLWETPQDAYSVRALLGDLLAACGYKPGTGGVAKREIEVFPKQDSVPAAGFGNMAVLPGFNRSTPLAADALGFGLTVQPREAFATLQWQWSAAVPVLVKPERSGSVAVGLVPVADVERALSFIDPCTLDYDGWWRVVCGVHAGTGGSDDGLALVEQWTQRNAEAYDRNPTHLTDRVWPYIKSRDDGLSFGSVLRIARQHGYFDLSDPEQMAAGFEFSEVTPEMLAEFERTSRRQREAFASSVDGVEPLFPGSRPGAAPCRADGLPAFTVHPKTGAILTTASNLGEAIASPRFIGVDVAYDRFKQEAMVARAGSGQYRPLTESMFYDVRVICERMGFATTPAKEMVRDALDWVAEKFAIDTAIDWLSGLQWDGVPRVEGFMHRYLRTENTPYTRAVARYLWTALAGRVLQPGVKADMVPVLIGSQGCGKSTAVVAMLPAETMWTEVDLAQRDDNTSRELRGVLIAEFAELRGLSARDKESLKAFITRTVDKWVPKYKELPIEMKRRFVFVGTTNQEEILADETGERRWLPVRVGQLGEVDPASGERMCDVEAIAADRLQLWAEAAVMFRERGVDWRDAQRLARDVHAQHKVSDPVWDDAIANWLRAVDASLCTRPADLPFIDSSIVLLRALKMDAKDVQGGTAGPYARLRRAMERHGYEYVRGNSIVGGGRVRGFARRPARTT